MKLKVTFYKVGPKGLAAHCSYIAEELRGKGLLAEVGKYKVWSNESPAFCNYILYVRGINTNYDDSPTCRTYASPEDRDAALEGFIKCIEKLRGADITADVIEVEA